MHRSTLLQSYCAIFPLIIFFASSTDPPTSHNPSVALVTSKAIDMDMLPEFLLFLKTKSGKDDIVVAQSRGGFPGSIAERAPMEAQKTQKMKEKAVVRVSHVTGLGVINFLFA